MSRELLSAIDLDSERLLFAGAQVARADGDLAAHAAPLAPLAAKAPALARVVEQVEKVRQSSGKASATELLNLASLMAQVRGAQASPAAPAGELAPLPSAVPIESPLAVHEVTSLVNALTNAEGASERPRTVQDAVERGAVRDLRLLPLCIPALSDTGIASAVEEKLLPALGEAIAPELEASLNIPGGRGADVRKLRALAAIRKAGALPLLREAIEKGTAELRAAALVALAGLSPSEAEPLAMRLAEADRAEDVRAAALEALGACNTDGALELLLATFTRSGKDRLRQTAGAALSHSPHPRATERLVALLTPELRELNPKKAPKSKSQAQPDPALKEWNDKVGFLQHLLTVLGPRGDVLARQTLRGILRDHKMEDVREAASRALLHSGDPEALAVVGELINEGKLPAWFTERQSWWNSDPKQVELALRMASAPLRPELAFPLLEFLVYRGESRLTPLLPGFLDRVTPGRQLSTLLQAMAGSQDASLAAPLDAWLQKNRRRLKEPERASVEETLAALRSTSAPASGS